MAQPSYITWFTRFSSAFLHPPARPEDSGPSGESWLAAFADAFATGTTNRTRTERETSERDRGDEEQAATSAAGREEQWAATAEVADQEADSQAIGGSVSRERREELHYRQLGGEDT